MEEKDKYIIGIDYTIEVEPTKKDRKFISKLINKLRNGE